MRTGLVIILGCLLAAATCSAQDGEVRQVIGISADVISSLHAQSGSSASSAQPDWYGISSAFAPGADESQHGSSPTDQFAARIVAMSQNVSREEVGVALHRLQQRMTRRQTLDALVVISMLLPNGDIIQSSNNRVTGSANAIGQIVGDAIDKNGTAHNPVINDGDDEYYLNVSVCACNI